MNFREAIEITCVIWETYKIFFFFFFLLSHPCISQLFLISFSLLFSLWSLTSSHPNHCKWNIPFCLTQRIYFIAEKNVEKLKNLEHLKSKLSNNHYSDSLIKPEFLKALLISQKDLKPKKPLNENISPFITTFNPNNSNIY